MSVSLRRRIAATALVLSATAPPTAAPDAVSAAAEDVTAPDHAYPGDDRLAALDLAWRRELFSANRADRGQRAFLAPPAGAPGSDAGAPTAATTTPTRTTPPVGKPAAAKTAASKSANARSATKPANTKLASTKLNSAKPAGTKPAGTKPAGPVAPPASGAAAAVVGFALAQVGDPYVWGASGPNAWDCSGLTAAAFRRGGVDLPHQSGAQRAYGRAVSRSQLQPADLVVYSGHVAIYVGDGRMVHAANPRKGVVVAAIYGTPIGYRRIL